MGKSAKKKAYNVQDLDYEPPSDADDSSDEDENLEMEVEEERDLLEDEFEVIDKHGRVTVMKVTTAASENRKTQEQLERSIQEDGKWKENRQRAFVRFAAGMMLAENVGKSKHQKDLDFSDKAIAGLKKGDNVEMTECTNGDYVQEKIPGGGTRFRQMTDEEMEKANKESSASPCICRVCKSRRQFDVHSPSTRSGKKGTDEAKFTKKHGAGRRLG